MSGSFRRLLPLTNAVDIGPLAHPANKHASAARITTLQALFISPSAVKGFAPSATVSVWQIYIITPLIAAVIIPL